MTSFGDDLRHGARLLAKSPGFTAIALLTLAIGIGANTALFSVVNGVLLNPLAYPNSSQLVALYGRAPRVDHAPISYPNFLDWQRDARVFSSMAIYRRADYSVTGSGEAERLNGFMVTAGFFSTLGVAPVLGRDFRPDDDILGAAPVAMISGGLLKRKFASSPEVLGRAMVLNGVPYTVIGIVPAGFNFYGESRDIYTPIGPWRDPSFRDRRISISTYAFGRLKPGVALAQAQADMDTISRNLADAFPQADRDMRVEVVSMKEDIVGKVKPLLLVLLAAVGFLLLIACANIANLLLARAMGRSREFAIRAALGASRARIVRQLLTESVLLAAVGGALGLLLAFAATRAVLASLPATLPRTADVSIDARVLLFTLALSMVAGIFFGLAPALRTSRTNLQQVMQEGGRGSSSTRHRLQGAFVVLEMSLALVLLVGGGLMLRTLAALWRVNPGYNPAHAITFSVTLPGTPGTTPAETRARLRNFDRIVRSVPGVEATSITLGSRPMIHDSSLPFWIEGRPKPSNDNDMPQALFYLADDGFAKAMGLTLQRGRFINAEDDENHPVAIVIDDAFARTYFPNQDPVGQHVFLTQFNVPAEIVGVAGHVKQWGPGADPKAALEAEFFYPFMQLPDKIMGLAAGGTAVIVRAQGDPAAVMTRIRGAVAQNDPREVIYNVETMQGIVANSLAPRRITMMLLGAFAALALAMACIGIYGVICYLVGQRTREIGVRMALGARPGDILRLVLGHGTRMALAGVAVGLIAAAGLTRMMSSQLFGVSARDPLTFVAVAALLLIVAVLACYIPARRAVRTDPMVALRYE